MRTPRTLSTLSGDIARAVSRSSGLLHVERDVRGDELAWPRPGAPNTLGTSGSSSTSAVSK